MSAALARDLACSQCGGRFPIKAIEQMVHCPFCAHRQRVPDALLQELLAYRQRFAEQQLRADSAVVEAQRWQEFSRSHAPPIRSATLVAAQLALLLPFAVQLLAQKALGISLSSVAVLAMYAPILGALWLAWRSRSAAATAPARAAPRRAQLGVHAISCPACGAENQHDGRRASASCAYCQSALFPSSDVIGRSLDAARAARRAALLEKYRVERTGMAQLAESRRAPALSPLAGWKPALIASLVLIGVLGGVEKEMLEGRIPEQPALHLAWLALPIGWLVFARRLGRKRARRQALEAALETVARQGRGTVDADVGAYVAWLNQHWAGPYDIPYTSLGSWFYSVRLKVGPYAGLAEINLEPPDLESPRINVLLAAWVPGVSDAEERAGAAPARPLEHGVPEGLRALGCSLQVTTAGLIAHLDLDPGRLQRFAREPESTTALMGIFAQLSRHAAQLGAL